MDDLFVPTPVTLYFGPIITSEEAKRLNLYRFFTGVPCRNGHIAERQTCDNSCRGCLKERRSQYASRPRISHKELLDLVSYDPETGLFRWLTPPHSKFKSGELTGQSPDKKGYLRVIIRGRHYKSHILAIFYMTGKWPEHETDHKNGIKTDNRWENLREANSTQSAQNRKRRVDNTTGYKGVYWEKRWKHWFSRITVNKKTIHLGSFREKQSACDAYNEAAKKYFGEFVRPQ